MLNLKKNNQLNKNLLQQFKEKEQAEEKLDIKHLFMFVVKAVKTWLQKESDLMLFKLGQEIFTPQKYINLE